MRALVAGAMLLLTVFLSPGLAACAVTIGLAGPPISSVCSRSRPSERRRQGLPPVSILPPSTRRFGRRADYLREWVLTFPYAPYEYRANGVVRNLAAFHEAFAVTSRDGLFRAPDDRVKIW